MPPAKALYLLHQWDCPVVRNWPEINVIRLELLRGSRFSFSSDLSSCSPSIRLSRLTLPKILASGLHEQQVSTPASIPSDSRKGHRVCNQHAIPGPTVGGVCQPSTFVLLIGSSFSRARVILDLSSCCICCLDVGTVLGSSGRSACLSNKCVQRAVKVIAPKF